MNISLVSLINLLRITHPGAVFEIKNTNTPDLVWIMTTYQGQDLHLAYDMTKFCIVTACANWYELISETREYIISEMCYDSVQEENWERMSGGEMDNKLDMDEFKTNGHLKLLGGGNGEEDIDWSHEAYEREENDYTLNS